MKRTTNYRPPVEESRSETAWVSRNDVENNKMPYDQIPDEDVNEDSIIDSINNSNEEEDFSAHVVDELVQHEDYWGVNRYMEKYPETKEYVELNYPEFFGKEVKELVDSIHDIEEHYSEYFPMKRKVRKEKVEKDIVNILEQDGISERKHGVEKKIKVYAGGTDVQGRAAPGDKKKDRRHGSFSTGKKDRRTRVNRKQRGVAKKELKDLFAA